MKYHFSLLLIVLSACSTDPITADAAVPRFACEDSMQRVRGQFVTDTKPAYDDPNDPQTHPAGYYRKAPDNQPTQVTADALNYTQEELAHLIEGLGDTLADGDDFQLAKLLAQGAFQPVLSTTDPNLTYQTQEGFYCRVGRWVYATVQVAWTNGEPSLDNTIAEVVLPYVFSADPAGPSRYAGILDFYTSDFGTANQTTGFYTPVVGGFPVGDALQVRHVSQPGGTPVPVRLGPNEPRILAANIWYPTNGEYQY